MTIKETMMRLLMAAVTAALLSATTPALAAPPARFSSVVADDLVSRMFVWWNAAFKDPNGFTPAAFGQYYTDDAVMRINGVDRAKGLDALASHFRVIQHRATKVDIRLPFVESFSSPDGSKIFTYHLIDAVEDGKPGHEMVMGYVTVRGGKIALVNFLSVSGQPGPFTR